MKPTSISEANSILQRINTNKIFSGELSKDMWDAINNAKTKEDLKTALYIVCCRIQELESKLDALNEIWKRSFSERIEE